MKGAVQIALCAALLGLFAPWSRAQAPGRRIAMVFGNQSYRTQKKLCATANDAKAVAVRLRRNGFTVDLMVDADYNAMSAALGRLRNLSLGPSDVLVFFYAGHGIDANGVNFLLPVDYRRLSEEHVRETAIPVDRILELVRGAGSSVLFIDACRTRELDHSAKPNGLSPFVKTGNSLLLTSASPDEEAQESPCDRDDANGIFTGALLPLLERPGLTLQQIVDEVKKAVHTQTGGRQNPKAEGRLDQKLQFVQGSNCSVDPADPKSPDSIRDAFECASQQKMTGVLVELAQSYASLRPGADGWWLLGRAYSADGDAAQARAAFAKAVELAPANNRNLLALASVLMELEQFRDAKGLLDKIAETALDFPGLCAKRVEVLEKLGNHGLADQLRPSCPQ